MSKQVLNKNRYRNKKTKNNLKLKLINKKTLMD